MANELGFYERDAARRHDARVVADVLRIRERERVRTIGNAKIVFVTPNGRLARRSRKYLTNHSLIADDYFPPCISDRQLAGLLWISIGGGGDTLPRLRLIANCTAAIMPRRDLISRMHRFFADLNPAMEKRFEALMTNERAEHFLMDRTLSDLAVITQDNFEEIYRDIEEAAAERVSERKDREIESLKSAHSQELEAYRAQIDELHDAATKASRAEHEIAHNMQGLADENEQLASRLDESELLWANACLKTGRRFVRTMYAATAMLCASVVTLASIIVPGSLALQLTFGGLTFVGTLALAVIGNRVWRNNPFERWISRRRDEAVERFARQSNIEHLLAKFEIDWDTETVVPGAKDSSRDASTPPVEEV